MPWEKWTYEGLWIGDGFFPSKRHHPSNMTASRAPTSKSASYSIISASGSESSSLPPTKANTSPSVMPITSAAQRAWDIPELRHTILVHLGRKKTAGLLHLSKPSFEAGVEVVWKKMNYEEYDKLRSLVTSMVRHDVSRCFLIWPRVDGMLMSQARLDTYCNAVRTFTYTLGWAKREPQAPNLLLQHLRLFPRLRYIPLNCTDRLDCSRMRAAVPKLIMECDASWTIGSDRVDKPAVPEYLLCADWKVEYRLCLDVTTSNHLDIDNTTGMKAGRSLYDIYRHELLRIRGIDHIEVEAWIAFFSPVQDQLFVKPDCPPLRGPSALELKVFTISMDSLALLMACFTGPKSSRSSLSSSLIWLAIEAESTYITFHDLLTAPPSFWDRFRRLQHITLPVVGWRTSWLEPALDHEQIIPRPRDEPLLLHSMTLVVHDLGQHEQVDVEDYVFPPFSILAQRLVSIGGRRCDYRLEVCNPQDRAERNGFTKSLMRMLNAELDMARRQLDGG